MIQILKVTMRKILSFYQNLTPLMKMNMMTAVIMIQTQTCQILKIFLTIKVNCYQFLELKKKQEFQQEKLMSLNISMTSMFNLNIKLSNVGNFSYFKLSWYDLHGNFFLKRRHGSQYMHGMVHHNYISNEHYYPSLVFLKYSGIFYQ